MSAAQLTQQIYCGLLTPAASIEGEKTIGSINLFLYGFLVICISVHGKNVILVVDVYN